MKIQFKKSFLNHVMLLLIFSIYMACTVPPQEGPDELAENETCAYAVSYTIDDVTFVHTETAIRADIWSDAFYPVNKKVYSVWTDQAPQFYFYCSATNQDEVSQHAENWQETSGTRLNLNSVGLESKGLIFKIEKEAFKSGDILKISFSGTTSHGLKVTNGLICATIDVVQVKK